MTGKSEDTRPPSFAFPPSFVRTTLVATGLFFCAGLVGVGLPLRAPVSSRAWAFGVIMLAFGLGLGAFGLRLWRRRAERVEVTQDGLRWIRRDGVVTLPWGELTAVRERFWLQCLELIDARGRRVIRLEYQLADFDRLRELIQERAPQLRMQHTRLRAFRRHPVVRLALLIPGVVFAALVWFVIPRTELLALGIFGTFALLALGVALTQLKGVHVGTDAITLAYPLRERTLAYDEIADVALGTVEEGGHAVPTVVVLLRDGRPIRLTMFREGTIALYDALRAAWLAARTVRV